MLLQDDKSLIIAFLVGADPAQGLESNEYLTLSVEWQ